MNRMPALVVLLVGVLGLAAPARAQDRQIRAFVGATFAGESTFVDLTKDDAPGHAHFTLGAQAAWLFDIFGVDVDVADTPGFFEGGSNFLVIQSRVTTPLFSATSNFARSRAVVINPAPGAIAPVG